MHHVLSRSDLVAPVADGNISTSPVLTLVLFKFAQGILTATVVADTLVRLAWKDNSRKEDGFLMERSHNGVDFSLVDSVGADVTTRSVAGVYVGGITYSFRVRAKSTHNVSAYSNVSASSPYASWDWYGGY